MARCQASHFTTATCSFPATGLAFSSLVASGRASVGACYSFEQSSGDGYMLLPEASEEQIGPPPAPRTQHSFTSIGTEPQSILVVFGGFALNIGCVNDLWTCTIGLDLASMPVPTWKQLEHVGEPPSPRYGHSATAVGAQKGQDRLFRRAGHAPAVRRPLCPHASDGRVVDAQSERTGACTADETLGGRA